MVKPRYQSGADDWYQERSRAPLTRPSELSKTDKDIIVATRARLDAAPFAQIGVSAIKWELHKLGLPFRSDSTINRTLKREGLVKKNDSPKGVDYPYFTEALCCNNIHQMDLVGPRYIKDDGRFYSMNVIDLYSHRVFIESSRTKEDDNIAQGLLRCWKSMGRPDFLQIDNELSFRGSNRYPRSLGLVLRLCLYFGVHPVFIPVGEPWRDGVIEHFNDTYDKKFFRRQWFSSYVMLKRQSKNFQRFHNMHHRYSCLKGKTPLEVIAADEFSPSTLGPNTRMPKLDFLPDGSISLIRFIRSDRMLNIFGEKFEVSKDLVYSYVRAIIVTEIHTLQIYQADDFIQSFEYRMYSGPQFQDKSLRW